MIFEMSENRLYEATRHPQKFSTTIINSDINNFSTTCYPLVNVLQYPREKESEGEVPKDVAKNPYQKYKNKKAQRREMSIHTFT
jgi:hypothetical protein